MIPYGIVTTALLYPNELRLSESLEGIFFKPVLTLYGEMFLSEYTEYDFNDGLTCSKTSDIIELQTTDSEYRKRREIVYKAFCEIYHKVDLAKGSTCVMEKKYSPRRRRLGFDPFVIIEKMSD